MGTVPVGLSRDLPPKRVMRAHADGETLVVWRTSAGEIAAWHSRCPHRGMDLSFGFVRGDALACLYHGWHFDGGGACSYIPAHPDLDPPATIRARVFSVTEQDGVIWVSVDGPATPPTPLAPSQPLRSLMIDASLDALRAACAATPLSGRPPERVDGDTYHFDGHWIAVLPNSIAPDRTQISVVASEGTSPPQLQALSRWCEALRRSAETQAEAAA